MVWFQCEDCGENLKKPKLPNHFRMCSATKLSCIDCGVMFGQQSVQTHTQCITEAEKYGPKGQAKSPHGAQQKPNKPKQGPDVDVNVGLSSRPPWKCSLCNTTTTSQQTLQLHAEGKKHRAKARAFHAAQNPSIQTEELIPSNGNAKQDTKTEVNGTQSSEAQEAEETGKDCSATKAELEAENGVVKKRKQDALTPGDATNGEVIQADKKKEDSQSHPKKKKNMNEKLAENDEYVDNKSYGDESPRKNIKWKKIVSSILKSSSDGAMKIKKLQKLAIKVVSDTGINKDEIQLRDELLKKISSSSQFVMEDKYVRLAAKGASS